MVPDTDAAWTGALADAARAELLARLAQFGAAPRTVLDVAGGVGRATDLAARLPRARIIATLDPAAADAGRASPSGTSVGVIARLSAAGRRLLPGAARATERLAASPDRLPLADGSIDAVLAHWFAPGAATLDAALTELRRVLVPGGLFLWTTPGLGATAEPVDMHDLGSALTRAGFVEPVLDVDRHAAPGGDRILEVIHAAAFAGEGRLRRPGAVGAEETLIPLERLGRRRGPGDPGT